MHTPSAKLRVELSKEKRESAVEKLTESCLTLALATSHVVVTTQVYQAERN